MKEYIEKWPVVNRLIDLENEFQQYKPFHGFEHAMYRKICEAEIAIGKTDAADVVERKRGEWVWDDHAIDWGLGGWVCNNCHARNDNIPAKPDVLPYAWLGSHFCPNCGADMRGVDHEKS